MQTAKMGRCASKILWEALLVKQRVAVVKKTEKVTGTKGYSGKNVCMCVNVYTDICKI
jgi:hypothetical protein